MSEHPSPCALPQLRIFCRQLILLTVSLSMGFSISGNAQSFNGQIFHTYSLEGNGTSYQVSGYPGQSFPSLTFYENHYYVLENNSTIGTLLSIGENNQSSYGKSDVWNNQAYGDDEYLLVAPDGRGDGGQAAGLGGHQADGCPLVIACRIDHRWIEKHIV